MLAFNSMLKKISIFVLASFFISCTTFGKANLEPFSIIENQPVVFNWQPLCSGIELCRIEYPSYPLILHVAKIDLSNTNIKVSVTEASMFLDNLGKVRAETCLAFAERNNMTLAVNGSFFEYKSMLFDIYRKVIGVHIYNGILLSPVNVNYAALVFYADNTASIVDKQSLETMVGAVFAISGYTTVISKSVIIPLPDQSEDSRTAVGLANNGKSLFVIVVEGEDRGRSRGLTINQTGFFLLKLGVDTAMHMDGGGSSSMVVKKNGEYKTIAPSIAWLGLRRVANNFGFIYKD